ncbi:uncharacterized protein isoform X2 [Rhodnius prolixus]|uniref:uncharacterized protein isoform X2 n=1 Tax=Rhodnius prolixus TaxID=13249 RepID=UPI003D188271
MAPQHSSEEDTPVPGGDPKLKSWMTLTTGKCIKRKLAGNKLDKELTRRICTEAKQLAKVCAEIYSRTGPVEHLRWDRPDKKVKISSFFEKSGNKICHSYLPAMEHTFDLLTVYMRLLVKYLHQIPIVNEYFATSGIVRLTDTNLALKTLACMLWNRIQYVQEILNRAETENKFYELGSTNEVTQTETVSLTSCENCHTSKSLIIDLVGKVELICDKYEFKGSHVMEVKKEMAMDVFYVSQWAAITKWCEAIGKDFQLLSDVAYDSLKTITNLRNENMALKKNINEADEVRLSLQKQVAIRNHKYEDVATETNENEVVRDQVKQYENLISKLKKELKEEKSKYIDSKEKFVNLSREINTKKLKIDYLEAELENIQQEGDKKIFNLNDEIAIKDFKLESLNKKIEQLTNELKCNEKERTILKDKVDARQKYESELWSDYKGVLEENKSLKENMEQNSEEMKLVMDQLQKLKKQLSLKCVLRAAITGNPLKDMEAQKMLNEARILALQEENKELTKTIIRLYAQNAAVEAVSEAKKEQTEILQL